MNFVVIKTFDNYFSANVLLARLESEGIMCYLRDEHTVTIDPLLTNAIGGIKLMVSDTDLDKAQTVLQSIQEQSIAEAICPSCHQKGFTYLPKTTSKNYVTAILTWIFSGLALAPDYVYRCNNCDYEVTTIPENDTIA